MTKPVSIPESKLCFSLVRQCRLKIDDIDRQISNLIERKKCLNDFIVMVEDTDTKINRYEKAGKDFKDAIEKDLNP